MVQQADRPDVHPVGYRSEYFIRLRPLVWVLTLASPVALLAVWLLNAWVTDTPVVSGRRLAAWSGACVIVAVLYACMRRAMSIPIHCMLTLAVLATTTLAMALLATPTTEGGMWMLPAILVVPFFCAPFWISGVRALLGCVASYAAGAAILPSLSAVPNAVAVYITLAGLATAGCLVVFHVVDRARRVSYEDRTSLFHDAHYDSLTGLASRRRFQESGAVAVEQCRQRDQPVCLAFIDLDHFKAVNDLHGHAAGDRALAAVAGIVLRHLGTRMLAGRFGGEEFVVLLPLVGLDAAAAFTERLARDISRRDLGGFTVSISAGVAELCDGESLSDLMHRADHALLEAKRTGRDRVVRATFASVAEG